MDKAEKELFDLASALDNQGDIKDEEMAEFESYGAKTEEALASAFDHIILLQARRQALTSQRDSGNDRSGQPSLVQGSEAFSTTVMSQTQPKAIELPPLPIPTFAGNIWEWDNFWEIFSNNIHSKDLPEMVKYNYLLDALEGEARESIMKYRVTKDNYPKAVASLHKKYNNKEALVNQLVDRLECCALRTPSIKDQRSLLEQLQTITTQLQDKGEDVNSSWLVKKVLAKFPDSTKRKVINRRKGLSTETPFTMSHLFQLIDETLSSEEMFQVFADKTPPVTKGKNFYGKKRPNLSITARCMYSKGSHASNQCPKYTTPQDSSSYLRQNNLCLICASPRHVSTQCKGRLCFSCNGPHNTSCCFKQNQQSSGVQVQERTISGKKAGTPKKKDNPKGLQGNIRSNMVTTQEMDNAGQETPLLPAQTVFNAQNSRHPCLPTGEATILDPENKSLIKVDVLFDTGAEVSFIDSGLARQLHLPVLEERQIRLNTFGAKEIVERNCQKVHLEIWDQEGNPHALELLTYDIDSRIRAPIPFQSRPGIPP